MPPKGSRPSGGYGASVPSSNPEQQARQEIDAEWEAAGWVIQDRQDVNLSAGLGVAVREFKRATAARTTCSSWTARRSAPWRRPVAGL